MEIKIYNHDAGHMTKMAAIPIYGISPLKVFLTGTSGPILANFGTQYRILKLIIFCSNDNPVLTLTYFIVWSNLSTKAFIWKM